MAFRFSLQCIYYGTFVFLSMALTQCGEGRKEAVTGGLDGQVAGISTEMIQVLEKHTLQLWYPGVIDSAFGGYFSNFNYRWEQAKEQNKFIVTQARHVWATSRLYEFDPDEKYLAYADNGYEFLKNHMWDPVNGGFVQLVNREGKEIPDTYNYEKRAYGNAFGIYALAAYYRVSGKQEVLDMAQKAFHWFDQHAHDSDHGGYFEYLTRRGEVLPVASRVSLKRDERLVGLKDYNSSIHIMEAFTELYHVWPDSLLHSRLEEMYHVVLDTMTAAEGYLKLYFYPDWTPLEDLEMESSSGAEPWYTSHITFGHDVETAYLLMETAETLGIHLSDAVQGENKEVGGPPIEVWMGC